MAAAVPSWLSSVAGKGPGADAPQESRPAPSAVPAPARPSGRPPSVRFAPVYVKQKKRFFFQLTNAEYDPFYADISNGDSYWLLPKGVPLSHVRYITHMSEAGLPYYESLRTKAVSWTLPEDAMTAQALPLMKKLTKMNRDQCMPIIRDTYDEDAMLAALDSLNEFAADVDEGVAALSDSGDEEVEVEFAAAAAGASDKGESKQQPPQPQPPNFQSPARAAVAGGAGEGADALGSTPTTPTTPTTPSTPGTPATPHPHHSLSNAAVAVAFASNVGKTPDVQTPGTPASPVPVSPAPPAARAAAPAAAARAPAAPAPAAPAAAATSSAPTQPKGPGLSAAQPPVQAHKEEEDSDASDTDIAANGNEQQAGGDENTTGDGGRDSPGHGHLSSAAEVARKELEDNSYPIQGLMSGFLEKQPQSKTVGEWKRRYFILSPLVLVYYQDYVAEIGGNSKIKPQGEVQIFPHTMVQKCASEAHSGGNEFIFRLLNSVTGDYIRISCASEATRDRWMQSILNTAINLQNKGFMADTFGSYQGLLSGYRKKYFVFVGSCLHQFATDASVCQEEAQMSINKKTKLERVEEGKGRLVLINATGTDGHAKYQLQLDNTTSSGGGQKSQFHRWLIAFQTKIQESAKEDAADLRRLETFTTSERDSHDDSASDVEMTPDKQSAAKFAGKIPKESTSTASAETASAAAAPVKSGDRAALPVVIPALQQATSDPLPLAPANSAPTPTTTPASSLNYVRTGEMPQRPNAGPPPAAANELPLPLPLANAAPALVDTPAAAPVQGLAADVAAASPSRETDNSIADKAAPAPAPAPAPVLSAEMAAMAARLQQLEREAQEREARSTAKKAKRDARNQAATELADAATGKSSSSQQLQDAGKDNKSPQSGQGQEQALSRADIARRKAATKAYLRTMYGESSDGEESGSGSESHSNADDDFGDDYDAAEEQDGFPADRTHRGVTSDSKQVRGATSGASAASLGSGYGQAAGEESSSKGAKRKVSIWTAPNASAAGADRGGASRAAGASIGGNVPFARQLFDKYCDFDGESGEYVVDTHGLQRLQYDHGFFTPLTSVLKSVRGVGSVGQNATFASATLNYEEFLVWYRLEGGTQLVNLKSMYQDKATGGADIAVYFYSLLKMCMLFRLHEADEYNLKGMLDRDCFAAFHERLLDEALLHDSNADGDVTPEHSWEEILRLAEAKRRATAPANSSSSGRARQSTEEYIILEDYLTWISEVGTEHIKPTPVQRKKGIASKTRNIFRSVFGIKKPVKTVPAGAESAAVLDQLHKQFPSKAAAASEDYFDANPSFPSQEDREDEYEDGEEEEDLGASPNRGQGQGQQQFHSPEPAAADRDSAMHARALAQMYGVPTPDSSSTDTGSMSSLSTPDADLHHQQKRGDNLNVSSPEEWAKLLDMKAKSIKNDPDFADCGISSSGASEVSGQSRDVPLPTSEDLFHAPEGPIHVKALPATAAAVPAAVDTKRDKADEEHRQMNIAHGSSHQSMALADAFASAMASPESKVTSDAPGPAAAVVPDKPMSALEKMALQKKKSGTGSLTQAALTATTAAAVAPPPPAAAPVDSNRPMTMKEKMAAAVEAKKRKDAALSGTFAPISATTGAATAGGKSGGGEEDKDAGGPGSDQSAPLPSPPPLGSGRQPPRGNVVVAAASSAGADADLPSKGKNGSIKPDAAATLAAVTNNKVSWDSPSSSPSSSPSGGARKMGPVSDGPVYSAYDFFDAYSSSSAPTGSARNPKGTDKSQQGQGQGNKAPLAVETGNSGQLVRSAAAVSANTSTLRQQEKSRVNAAAAAAVAAKVANFNPSKRKQIAAFRPQMAAAAGAEQLDVGAPEGGYSQSDAADSAAAAAAGRSLASSVALPRTSALSSTEQVLLAQLGLANVSLGELSEGGEAWEAKVPTSLAVAASSDAAQKPLPPPPPSALFTPRAQQLAFPAPPPPPPAVGAGAGAGAGAAPPPPPASGRGRRSSVSVFMGTSTATSAVTTATRAVQTGNSEVGQGYVVVGFADKSSKIKHKHSKHVDALKAEAEAKKSVGAGAGAGASSSSAEEEEAASRVPKSAFHLILGERYAVDDMWLQVRDEEAKCQKEIEAAEAGAARRIHQAELDSLKKVQFAWSQRDAWHKGAAEELAAIKADLDSDNASLEVRRNAAASVHKQCSQDLSAAYKFLGSHYEAISKEKSRLHNKIIRSELDNCLMNITLADAQFELVELLKKSKSVHAIHLELDKESAASRQKRLPAYMQHGDMGDAYIESLMPGMRAAAAVAGDGESRESAAAGNLPVATTAVSHLVGKHHSHASHASHGHAARPQSGSSSSSVNKSSGGSSNGVTFHKYDPKVVKLPMHHPHQPPVVLPRGGSGSGSGSGGAVRSAQAKKEGRGKSPAPSSSSASSSGAAAESKQSTDMNFRTAEHEQHLVKYKQLYVSHPETHGHLKVPTRKSMYDISAVARLQELRSEAAVASGKDPAGRDSRQNQRAGAVSMSHRPTAKGATPGVFLKRGAGTGGTAGTSAAQDWRHVSKDPAAAASAYDGGQSAPTEEHIAAAVAIANERAAIALQNRREQRRDNRPAAIASASPGSPLYNSPSPGTGTGTSPTGGVGKGAKGRGAGPFSLDVYSGFDTKIDVPKDFHGHYDIGTVATGKKYVPLHTRTPTGSPTRAGAGAGAGAGGESPRKAFDLRAHLSPTSSSSSQLQSPPKPAAASVAASGRSDM